MKNTNAADASKSSETNRRKFISDGVKSEVPLIMNYTMKILARQGIEELKQGIKHQGTLTAVYHVFEKLIKGSLLDEEKLACYQSAAIKFSKTEIYQICKGQQLNSIASFINIYKVELVVKYYNNFPETLHI